MSCKHCGWRLRLRRAVSCTHDVAPPRRLVSTSTTSTSQEFYRNQLIEQYAQRKATAIGLRQFTFFGRKMDEQRLLQSANFVRTELPIRIAHRIRSMQDLPFGVGTNKHLVAVRNLYQDAFDMIRRFPAIQTAEDNQRFCQFMQTRLKEHLAVIPKLAVGVAETEGELSPSYVDTFMTNMLRSRLARRVLTEQHLELTQQCLAREKDPYAAPSRYIGVIDTQLAPEVVARHCVQLLSQSSSHGRVAVQTAGRELTLAYIPDHLTFMLFELIKNSLRATVERNPGVDEASLPPVEVTIVHSPENVVIRISDQGGGIAPLFPLPQAQTAERAAIFSFVHVDAPAPSSTPKHRVRAGKLARLRDVPTMSGTVQEQVALVDLADSAGFDTVYRKLGIGLPLSRIYAEFFGGTLKLYSMIGHGVDAFLTIPRINQQAQVN